MSLNLSKVPIWTKKKREYYQKLLLKLQAMTTRL